MRLERLTVQGVHSIFGGVRVKGLPRKFAGKSLNHYVLEIQLKFAEIWHLV